MEYIWAEKYRPTTLDGFVFKDENQKEIIEGWIKEGEIPHLLLSGTSGVGKSTLAKILFNELEIDEYDILEINASRENSVDTVREKIVNFSQTMPFGKFKIILLDECDFMTPNSQAILRGVMESYSSSCRFILTCNYPNRILPALHSRTQGFHIDRIDQDEFIARIATILIKEEVEVDLDTLDTYVKATYPDLRKCINLVQMNVKNKVLTKSYKIESNSDDYKIKAVELFKANRYLEARKLICSQCRQDEMVEFYRWAYDNYTLFSDTEDGHDQAILIIRKGLVNHSLVIDPEINLSATIIELSQIE